MVRDARNRFSALGTSHEKSEMSTQGPRLELRVTAALAQSTCPGTSAGLLTSKPNM